MMPTADSLSATFVQALREDLLRSSHRILHCLNQLTDDDAWWRPFESANSIQNIVLHLCGNLRQWVLSGIGGAPDVRNRPAEFSDRTPIPTRQLAAMLAGVIVEVDAVLAGVTAACITEPRRIQGHDETVLSAMVSAITHFVGHTHQIVYITRLRLGDAYRFYWVPQTPEQISAGKA